MSGKNGITVEHIQSRIPAGVLIYIPKGEKGPKHKKWEKTTFAATQFPTYQKMLRDYSNTGILLGEPSGNLVALDFDLDSDVQLFLNDNPRFEKTLRTRGARGCQFWFFLTGNYPRQCISIEDRGEWRGGACQSVLRGLHPTGSYYTCLLDAEPITLAFSEIVLPDWLRLAVEQEKPRPKHANPSAAPNHGDNSVACFLKERTLEACQYYLINGFERKGEWRLGDLDGNAGNSASIALYGENAGVAFDFNGRQPGLILEVIARALGLSVTAAAKQIKKDFGLSAPPLEQGDGAPPFNRKLNEEQRQRGEMDDDSEASRPDTEISLEEQTQERLRQYSEDPEPFPSPMRSEGFHGVIGEIASVMGDHCESSPEVLLVHGLVIVGNILGRSAFIHGGGPKLFPNEFAVFVGETARGRKGTAYYMWQSLAEHVNQDWLAGCLSSNAQSGEGIVYRVRDEHYGIPPGKKKKGEPVEEVLIDAGVSDKRLMIVEEEFSHVLKMAQRNGNSLTEMIRKAWDSPSFLKTDNKNSPLKSSDPHVSLIGHITRQELLDTLKTVDLNNGMANRILWCAARRTGDMPNPEYLDWTRYPTIIEGLQKVFRQRFPNTAGPTFFSRTPDAKNYWDGLYRKLNAEKQQSTVDAVLARDTAHILKVALIFAIADQQKAIGMLHLKAALAAIDFCRDSARWKFGKSTSNKLANNILWKR